MNFRIGKGMVAPMQSENTKSKSEEVIESVNPCTNEVVGAVVIHSEEHVNAAVARARDAFDLWSALLCMPI